jgi:hypothetical protein
MVHHESMRAAIRNLADDFELTPAQRAFLDDLDRRPADREPTVEEIETLERIYAFYVAKDAIGNARGSP